jgi:hypothetical protein
LLLFVPSWQGSTCAAPCPKAGKQLARFEAVLLMLRSRRGGQDRGAAQRVTARHVRFSVDQKWPLGWWACRCYTALLLKDFNFVISKISVTTEITEFREIRLKFRRNFFRD